MRDTRTTSELDASSRRRHLAQAFATVIVAALAALATTVAGAAPTV